VKSEEFFREVDEELQRDRMLALWRRYGSLVMVLAVAAVLATAGWVAWQHWQERQRAAEAERFAAAIADIGTKPAEAATRLDGFAAEARTGYGALARLREAEAKATAGDEAGAVATLEALAADGSADPLLRDLAAVLAAGRQVDTGDPAALKARLEPLAAAGAPYRYTARELLALLAIRTGDSAGARSTLEELSKEVDIPQAQQQRVGQLLATLGGIAAP
jgi:hypothetical protein